MCVESELLLAFKTQLEVQRPGRLSRDLSGKIIKTSNTCQQHNSVGNITSCHISNDNNERPEFSAMLKAVSFQTKEYKCDFCVSLIHFKQSMKIENGICDRRALRCQQTFRLD